MGTHRVISVLALPNHTRRRQSKKFEPALNQKLLGVTSLDPVQNFSFIFTVFCFCNNAKFLLLVPFSGKELGVITTETSGRCFRWGVALAAGPSDIRWT